MLLTLLILAHAAIAVKLVNSGNYSEFISEENGPAMLLFFAPWCGHCKKFKPDFKTAGDKLQGIVSFGAIDCTDQQNQYICNSQNIRGYPTVKFFNSEVNPGKVLEYTGDRSVNNVLVYAMSNVKDYAFTVSSKEELARHLSNKDEGDKLIILSKGKTRTANSHAAVRNFLKTKGYLGEQASDHAIVVLNSESVLEGYTGPYEETIKKLSTTGGLFKINSEGVVSVYEGELSRRGIVEWVKL